MSEGEREVLRGFAKTHKEHAPMPQAATITPLSLAETLSR